MDFAKLRGYAKGAASATSSAAKKAAAAANKERIKAINVVSGRTGDVDGLEDDSLSSTRGSGVLSAAGNPALEGAPLRAAAIPPVIDAKHVNQFQHINFSGEHDDPAELKERDELQQQSRLVMSYIRDDWIRKQMAEREAEFTQYRRIVTFVGTWNVNGKKPSENLSTWLCYGNPTDRLPDIYVVGLQEIVDLTAGNVVNDSHAKDRSHVWADILQTHLDRMAAAHPSSQQGNQKLKYHKVADKHLVGILLCVFVLEVHAPHVVDPQATSAATGIMGVVGNKGGAAIRLKLYDSTFCFVSAHLAAHRGAVENRNQDFADIMNKVVFRDEFEGGSGNSSGGASSSIPAKHTGVQGGGGYGIREHDYVIWCGDFNYRIRASIEIDEVFHHIERSDLGQPHPSPNAQLLLFCVQCTPLLTVSSSYT